jgi:ribA/ribD-fused uncharacterized protein
MTEEPKCEKCEREATYDSPALLCDEHWLGWFNHLDEDVCIGMFKEEFSFLSNFFEGTSGGEVVSEGLMYPTVEHFYQAQKTLDFETRKKFSEYRTPGIAKRQGRKLELRPDWESVKVDVMREALRQKFAKETLLGNMLMATFPAKLEEGNWWGDTFWGVDIKTRKGQNWLGRLLMERRKELMMIDGD